MKKDQKNQFVFITAYANGKVYYAAKSPSGYSHYHPPYRWKSNLEAAIVFDSPDSPEGKAVEKYFQKSKDTINQVRGFVSVTFPLFPLLSVDVM